MSPVFNTEFPVNKNSQREFPSFQGDPSKMFCSDTTRSNLNSFSSFFFEHARNIIPDISVSLEYFILAGEQSYFIISPVGGQLHQFPCIAILHTINWFLSLHDYRIILDISASSEYSASSREQVPFHIESISTSKSEFGALQAILHHFA